MDATCLNELLVNVKERVPDGFSKKFFQYQINKIGPLWYVPRSLGVQTLLTLSCRDQNRQADYAKETTVPVPGEDRSYGAFERWYGFRFQRLTFTVRLRPSAISATRFYRVLLPFNVRLS